MLNPYLNLALFAVALLTTSTILSAPLTLRVPESPTGRVEAVVAGRAFLTSPDEGLWSVATNWTDGWPSGWVHASPDKVERAGDWTLVSGKLALADGVMQVRDAYRLEHGIVRGTRRWTWTGKE